MSSFANIPMKSVGPIKITGPEICDDVMVPLATYETPLWPSTNRGAKLSRLAGGIQVVVVKDIMTRSVLVEAPNNIYALDFYNKMLAREDEMADVVKTTSSYAKLKQVNYQLVGNLIYIRFGMSTGDASGHNMATKAADALLGWILNEYPKLKYVSISGNYCIDKKVSAVNGILGRGKYTIAEIVVSRELCKSVLNTTPEKIVDLNIKKNLIGTSIAGGIRTANAHFANMLLAYYLAFGQDAANIVEGSQGIVHAELKGDDLYFSVTIPNVIVGTVGNGKHIKFVKENLESIGCLTPKGDGVNGRRLAAVLAATVLCGEISLLAAQTNPGELMRSHITFERKNKEDKTLSNTLTTEEA